MTRSVRTAIAAIGIALVAGTIATPVLAADAPYNATVAGQRSMTPLVALAPSSTLTVDVVNLPAGVGLYAIHCKVPADPRQPPALCDASTGALNVLAPEGALRATATIPIRVNAEFYGANPNPTGPVTARESVDCRVATGDPRSTTCALYVLGSGKDSANPAYLRFWPTVFSPVKADRKADVATVTLAGTTVAKGAKPKLAVNKATKFSVTLASGLTPSLSSDNCALSAGKITALKSSGTCTVTITSTGGRNYLPIVTTQVFRLTK
jgi:hypothetical protein